MKILKIEFENINSLKGRHQIDFTKAPFTVSSLFAITGATGSGKSTILDVISLALFNMVPRLGKISKSEVLNKGALLTRNQKQAFARVTYQTKTGSYASEWSISTNRNHKLRDYEMQIFDLATDKALDYKKSDIPSKNEELIGLNYNQFIKSVLLAQGDFAQFLKARKDERGELLEKITGTGIYRQLGIKAFQKHKQVSAESEEKQREINLLKNDLLEEDVLASIHKSLAEKTSECEPLEKNILELEKQLELKKNIEEHETQLAKQQNFKNLTEKKLNDFNENYREKITRHEEVQVFAEDLRNWRLLEMSCSEIKTELENHARKKKENEQKLASCIENIQTFLNATPEASQIEQSLQNFSRKVRSLQDQKTEKQVFYKNLQEKFHFEVREVPFQLNGDLEEEEIRLKEMLNSGEGNLHELQQKLNDLNLDQPESEKIRLREILQKGRRAQSEAVIITGLTSEIENLEKEEQKLLPEIEALPKQIELASAKAETFREKLSKLQLQRENELLKASLKEHRHHLQNGAPCPLCGATQHPYAGELPPKNDKIQHEISEVQKSLTILESEITSFKTSLHHYQSRLKDLQTKLNANRKQVESQKAAFETDFTGLKHSEETWEQFCETRENKLSFLEQFVQEKRKVNAIHAGLKVIPEIKEVISQGKKIKNELEELYSGNDIETDCLNLQKTWNDLNYNKTSVGKLISELHLKLEGKSAALTAVEEDLKTKISEINCEEIKDALLRLMPESDYVSLRKERENLTSQKGQFEATLNILNEQLERLKQKDVAATHEALREELKTLKEQFNDIKAECEALRRQQLNDKERRDRIAGIENEIAGNKQRTKRWELLNTLIGDATGKKFNDFAQDLSLSHLLILANRRLIELSDRYTLDKPLEGEDDSLVAIDEHMGGQRRSVKTLSGGETFILSLSMALALSDLASKNVEINSLFIDEGFGTLDPETLDQTLDTLEKLQAESSKTIGIISHVESLKERIATQIKLTRNGQGYSTLEIIG